MGTISGAARPAFLHTNERQKMSEDLNDKAVSAVEEKTVLKNLNPQAALDLKMMEFDTMILKSKEQTARLEREKSEFLLNFNYNLLEKQSQTVETKEDPTE